MIDLETFDFGKVRVNGDIIYFGAYIPIKDVGEFLGFLKQARIIKSKFWNIAKKDKKKTKVNRAILIRPPHQEWSNVKIS